MTRSGKMFGIILLSVLACSIARAQWYEQIRFFPDTAYVSEFVADPNAHRMEVHNILIGKDIRASMGGIYPMARLDWFGLSLLANLGASVHFELHPVGQAQIVSNEYYVDYLLLDVPLIPRHTLRFVTGHTSHHLSDNWFERLQLTNAVRFSRDYVKFFYIWQEQQGGQWYAGVDYAYIMTIGQRLSKPWTFQSGGKWILGTIGTIGTEMTFYAAADCLLRQESAFAATTTIQAGVALPMQKESILRFALQFRSGLDSRGQFFPQHRSFVSFGFTLER